MSLIKISTKRQPQNHDQTLFSKSWPARFSAWTSVISNKNNINKVWVGISDARVKSVKSEQWERFSRSVSVSDKGPIKILELGVFHWPGARYLIESQGPFNSVHLTINEVNLGSSRYQGTVHYKFASRIINPSDDRSRLCPLLCHGILESGNLQKIQQSYVSLICSLWWCALSPDKRGSQGVVDRSG